ncbi:DUF2855 family protein [Dactylosporangium sp. NPDC005572]|uniref:DUF2855 family protein n=1 Tax=Dactylosporangium sp. NPDC005572 TaxID=3156889 RepID=UPI0033BBAFFD
MARHFEVRTDDLSRTRVTAADDGDVRPGEVLAEIEHFGLSTNNVTYARLGRRLGYWRLFPAAAPWGRVPAWGYLRVVHSTVAEVETGRRLFGLCPMSTHVTLRPGRAHRGGFADASEHRAGLSAAYNAYSYLDTDPAHRPDLADHLLVLRPLMWLSYLVDDLLAEHGWFGAERAIVTSASSRAATGLARLLARRGLRTVGLTAPHRRAAVAGLGVYDEVLTYDTAGTAGTAEPTVLVDVAGDDALRGRLAAHLGDALRHTVVAGFTHDATGAAPDLPAPRTTTLFVPDRMAERARRLGWNDLNAGYVEALHDFAAWSRPWLRVTPGHGPAAVAAAYDGVLTGTTPPATAHVLTLSEYPGP